MATKPLHEALKHERCRQIEKDREKTIENLSVVMAIWENRP